MILKQFNFNQFPTHVNLSKNKTFKISTQSIYNHRLHHHERSKIISFMKEYVKQQIPSNWCVSEQVFPVKLHLTFYTPINWASVRMVKGELKWKKPANNYQAQHDLDNLAWIWGKVIQDCLKECLVIPEDTVDFVNDVEYSYVVVDTFEDRQIHLQIIKE